VTSLSKGPPSHVLRLTNRYPLFIVAKDKSPPPMPIWAMGRVSVHIYGRPKGRGTRNLIDDYASRNSSAGMELVVHSDKTGLSDYEQKIESRGAELILLDESGSLLTSMELAELISEVTVSDRNTIFAVGPADGFSDDLKLRTKKISISKMTLTHEMATVILLEQLYRASEINKGSQYHRS